MSGETVAALAHVLCTAYRHAPVYSVDPLKATYGGCIVFSCNLPPALLAEWLGSSACYCSNTGLEQIPKQESLEQIPKQESLEQIPKQGSLEQIPGHWNRYQNKSNWNRYQNKSQHRKMILEKKILPTLLWSTFQSQVQHSTHWSVPCPLFISVTASSVSQDVQVCTAQVYKWPVPLTPVFCL